ncbi:hypothetical protein HKW97_24020 (plasmid) [Pseudomonas luteola]|uniref:hypothetical protein n=1 Tax=Pseudomonas luteola TaxID=47886 RepID=UPI00388D77D5
MHKILSLALSICMSSVQAGELSVDSRCFSDAKGKINLEFRAYSDADIGPVGGQVRYRQSRKFIPLVYKQTTTLMEVEDRPWEFQDTWLEVLNGAITGQYDMITQGALIYSFSYTSKRTGKTIHLSKQTYPDESGKCTWQ